MGARKTTRRRPKIYLAGPISGCNEEQKHGWRRRIRARWGGQYRFLDPTDSEVHEGVPQSAFEIVKHEGDALEACHAVLANMWKESIGTAIGVYHARALGKPVVAIDPNHLQSSVLGYYADAVEFRETDAMRSLRDLLRAEERLRRVLKRDGSHEPFDRSKLAKAIRGACRAAGQDDVQAPAEIVPRVLRRLVASRKVTQRTVPSQTIQLAVWRTLAAIESDPLRAEDFEGIREAWEAHADLERRPSLKLAPRRGGVRVRARPLGNVRCAGTKSHTSIWGRAIRSLSDVPARPRRAFREICRVEGISEIRFASMQKGTPQETTSIELIASKVPGTIEGKCFDNGTKGQVQCFQVRVHDHEQTDEIRKCLLSHLLREGYARVREAN